MITFFCPSCQSSHRANDAFAGMRAKCVRCGASLVIPRDSQAAGPSVDEDRLSIDELADRRARKAGTAQVPALGDGPSLDAPGADAPPAPFAPPPAGRPKWVLPVAAVAVAAVAAGAGGYFLLGKPKPPPKPPAPPPAATEPDQPAPPPQAPPEGADSPAAADAPAPPGAAAAGVAAAVAPTRPADVPVLTAARLAAERGADPDGWDQRYAGKSLEVQGVCGQARAGRVTIQSTPGAGGTGPDAVVATLAQFGPGHAALLGPAVEAGAGPPEGLKVGRPVTVRAVPQRGGRLAHGFVVRTTAPADDRFLGRRVAVQGVVGRVEAVEDPAAAAVLAFDPPTTDGLVAVSCRFRESDRGQALALKPGQPVVVRGVCSGRTGLEVRLEDCGVGGPPAGAAPVPVADLVAAYEADLLAAPPVDPTGPPVKVTAEQLAEAFRATPGAAAAEFGRRRLEVTGAVAARQPGTRTVTFETGTTVAGKVVAAFTLAEFAKVPADEPTLTVRGVFGGPGARGLLRLESAEVVDPDAGKPAVKQVTPDYLPLPAGREWEAVRVTHQEVAVRPGKPKAYPAQLLRFRVADDRVRVSVTQAGTFPGPSLLAPDAPQPRWAKQLSKPLAASPVFQEVRVRATEAAVEYGTPGGGPDQPDGLVWEPVLKLGAKAGKSWTAEPAPKVTYKATVTKFFEVGGRDAVQVESTVTEEGKKDVRREAVVVYVKGVGEVSRAESLHQPPFGTRLLFEQKRVEDPAGGELRGKQPAGQGK